MAPLTAEQFNAIRARLLQHRIPEAVPHTLANDGFVALFHAILDELMLVDQERMRQHPRLLPRIGPR